MGHEVAFSGRKKDVIGTYILIYQTCSRASENPQYGRIYALEPSKHSLELPIRSEKYALKVRSRGENTP